MADLDFVDSTIPDRLESDDSPPRDAHPCPICDHDGWCTRNKTKAFCRRHSATAVPPEWRHVKECRDGSHMYVLRGSESRRDDDGGHSASASREKHGPCAHPSDLDWVYRQLLLRLPLTAAHRADLLRRGLPADSLGDYGSLPLDAERRHGAAIGVAMAAADRIAAKTDKEWGDAVGDVEAILAGSVPGFVHDGFDLSISGPAGLLIPVRDDCGWIIALKVRRDAPGADPKYLYLTSAREVISAAYDPEVTFGPSPGSPVHVPHLTEHHFRARLRAEIRHRHSRSGYVPGTCGVGFVCQRTYAA